MKGSSVKPIGATYHFLPLTVLAWPIGAAHLKTGLFRHLALPTVSEPETQDRPTTRSAGPRGGKVPGAERWSHEVDQMLGQMLRQAVWERLDMLDELATSADNPSLLSALRSELPRLTHGWRALLASHAPDPRGRCPECSSPWRSREASCSVWRTAHVHIASTEMASSDAVSAGSEDSGSVLSRFRARFGFRARSESSPSSSFSSVSFGAKRRAWEGRQSPPLFSAAVAAGTGTVH